MTPTWGIRAYTGEFYLVIFSKNEKIFQKSMFYGLFCSKFCTDHFSAVHFGLSGPTYAKNSKNCRKFGKNRPAWDSNFSKLGPKSKNRLHWCKFYIFLVYKSPKFLTPSHPWSKWQCTKVTLVKNRKSPKFAWA